MACNELKIKNYDEITKQIGRFVLLAVNSELIRYTDKYDINDFLERYKGTSEARAIAMIDIAAEVYKSYDIEKLNDETPTIT